MTLSTRPDKHIILNTDLQKFIIYFVRFMALHLPDQAWIGFRNCSSFPVAGLSEAHPTAKAGPSLAARVQLALPAVALQSVYTGFRRKTMEHVGAASIGRMAAGVCDIDGSVGEGGGQILRIAVALVRRKSRCKPLVFSNQSALSLRVYYLNRWWAGSLPMYRAQDEMSHDMCTSGACEASA